MTKDSSSFDVTLFAGNTALQKAVDEVRLGQSEQEGNHEDEHHRIREEVMDVLLLEVHWKWLDTTE